MKSLEEVADIVGLSRNMIQRYEAKGLVSKPKHKNKYGYLLYDQGEINKLWQMKFYKELGYKINDIENHMAKKGRFTETELDGIILKLKKERKRLDNIIKIAEAMRDTGMSFEGMLSQVEINEELPANSALEIVGAAFDAIRYYEGRGFELEEPFNEEELRNMFECGANIINCFKKGQPTECEEVQHIIKEWHEGMEYKMTDSVLPFSIIVSWLTQGSEMREVFTKWIEPEKIDYILDAVHYYCSMNADNTHAKEMIHILSEILTLGEKQCPAESKEVQGAIEKLHVHLLRLRVYDKIVIEGMLRGVGGMFTSDAFKQMIDEGSGNDTAEFVSKAIEIYLDKKGELEQ